MKRKSSSAIFFRNLCGLLRRDMARRFRKEDEAGEIGAHFGHGACGFRRIDAADFDLDCHGS